MPQSIEIRLEKAYNGLIFQVTEQAEKLRDFGIGNFQASNGWAIESVSHPDIDVINKRIFLRGDAPDMDMVIQLAHVENTDRINQAYDDILSALNEFVNSPAYNKFMDVPSTTPTHFTFG